MSMWTAFRCTVGCTRIRTFVQEALGHAQKAGDIFPDVSEACNQLAELLASTNSFIVERATELLICTAKFTDAIAALEATQVMPNLLAHLHQCVSSGSSTHRSLGQDVLLHAVLTAIHILVAQGHELFAESALQQLPELVLAARWRSESPRLAACMCIAELTGERFHIRLASLDTGRLLLPRPLGRSPGVPANDAATAAQASADAGASSSNAASTSEQEAASPGLVMAWRLRSLVLPVLVHLLGQGDTADAPARVTRIARVLEQVMQGQPALQNAVADSCALEPLTASLILRSRDLPEVKVQKDDAMDVDTPEATDSAGGQAAQGTASPVVQDLLPLLRCIELLCARGTASITEHSRQAAESLPAGQHTFRKQDVVCAHGPIMALCKCLQQPSPQLQLAAVRVLYILGRVNVAFTPKSLNEGLLERTLLAAAEHGADMEVRRTACMAVGNFVAPASPARQSLIDKVSQGDVAELP